MGTILTAVELLAGENEGTDEPSKEYMRRFPMPWPFIQDDDARFLMRESAEKLKCQDFFPPFYEFEDRISEDNETLFLATSRRQVFEKEFLAGDIEELMAGGIRYEPDMPGFRAAVYLSPGYSDSAGELEGFLEERFEPVQQEGVYCQKRY